MKPVSKWLLIFAFFNIYVIWGSTYLAVAYGLKGLPPFMLIAMRYLVAGIILLAVRLFRKEPFPPLKAVMMQSLSGILMLVGGTGMIAWAEQYISSGQAAILIATEPLWFLVLDTCRWREYFSSGFIITGLLVGFTGIYLFIRLDDVQMNTSTMGNIATFVVLASAAWWVIGSLISNRHKGESTTMMIAAIQLLAAGLASSIICGLMGETKNFTAATVPVSAWSGLLFLIVMGSLVAFMSYMWLISIRPPALVSTHTYVNPVVAVLLGWLFIHEHLAWGQLLGLIVILFVIFLVNIPEYRKRKAA